MTITTNTRDIIVPFFRVGVPAYDLVYLFTSLKVIK
jgi:hypothetical protein